MATIYTSDEVSRHDNAKDLWMTMHGGVYDLTDFLLKHPGGEEVLLSLAGKDGTVCFDEIGHTEEAIQLRETLKVGEVTGASSGDGAFSSAAKKREPSVDDDDWVYEEPKKNKMSPLVPAIIGAGVVMYAALFNYLLY